jgi:hypothetical protein
MAETKKYFLDFGGLQALWGKMKNTFAAKDSVNALGSQIGTINDNITNLNKEIESVEAITLSYAPKTVEKYSDALATVNSVAAGQIFVVGMDEGEYKEGFYIVEPKPYWSLGRFPETLMNIDVQTAPIMVNNEKETAWLANYKFAPVSLEGVAPLVNSRRVADLEYFCKGERGTSNALVGWPDTPDYVAKVNPNSKNGYSILTVHYAFVGANASNQKSEKDIIFVAERGSDAVALLSNIKSALEGNALIEE